MNKAKRLPALAAPLALLAALALAASLAGCSMPPYNEELSLAQVTRSKLGQPVNKIGPVYIKLDDSATQNQYYFLPERDDPVNSGGFLVAEASYGLRVWYLADYSTGLEASWSIDLANSSATTNNFLLQPVDSGAVDANYFLILTRYLQDDLRLILSTGTASVNQSTTELPLGSNLPGATNVLGSNIFPDSTSGSDLQFFLAGQGSSYYFEYGAQTDTADGFTYNSSGLATDLGPVPDGLTNAFYVHDPVLDRSYLSYWSGSSYVTYAWAWDHEATAIAASGFQQLTGVKGRIEAVLSNGQILAIDEGVCKVYGPVGNKLYKFPLGSLKFCYERYDSGTPTLYFSLAYWQYGSEEKPDQLHVEVYAIPTANLANLD
jgi:hypothetical protein